MFEVGTTLDTDKGKEKSGSKGPSREWGQKHGPTITSRGPIQERRV